MSGRKERNVTLSCKYAIVQKKIPSRKWLLPRSSRSKFVISQTFISSTINFFFKKKLYFNNT